MLGKPHLEQDQIRGARSMGKSRPTLPSGFDRLSVSATIRLEEWPLPFLVREGHRIRLTDLLPFFIEGLIRVETV